MATRALAAAIVAVLLVITFPWNAQAQARATLRWGSRGNDVCVAQRRLKAWGYYTGAVDCIYGRQTYAAVTLFQKRNGLTVDGVVGPETWAALGYWGGAPGGAATAQTTAAAGSREGERDLLARVVSAEARGEPYEGQVAVAAVILNRVRDSRFPNTLAGVVYQAHAFESVTNGTIYAPATSSAIRAAQDALNGWDPSGGALFFWNPQKASSGWIWTRPIIKRIGNHVFAK
ncbi:N-acetylmuramoyl-L-alanine amidase [Symbiobacterium terraclitae]|uniref:Spore cortex-lytic enzyme n=1 Tax=Symbiobacterium terraclitae TaxID=557451 RepID=A0ABS4JQ18_9FIRM|nr:spore cortex-lytic enzyme [Symbiobacterium terraclitae]MBP2017040.1 N-acetylmuramoyl-L-alanine amidase [Symbiobacterium terraclitae]